MRRAKHPLLPSPRFMRALSSRSNPRLTLRSSVHRVLAAVAIDLGATALRLLVDLVAVALLAVGLSYRRHGRRDLVVLQVIFNVGLFAAVVVIAGGEIAAAVGFGLFAVLSIIRLRAETLANADIAYFFAAIVLGLVTAVDLSGIEANVALALLVLAAPGVIDHPRLLDDHERTEVTLDIASGDREVLRRLTEERVGTRVVRLDVLSVDLVREVTRVQVLLAQPAKDPR